MSVTTRPGAVASVTRDPDRADGQVLVIFALFLVVLLGFTALVVDYGSYLLSRRNYQNLADSAALAGSVQLLRPITSAEQDKARAASWQYLKAQLNLTFPPSGNAPTGDNDATHPYQEGGWSIWVDTPPTAAGSKYAGDSNVSGNASVHVRLERDNPAFFSRVFGLGGRTIDGWATAGLLPSKWAVIALCPRNDPSCGPPHPSSLTLGGTGTTLKVINGDIGDNWGLKTSGGTQIQLPGDSQAYLVDTTCGNGSSQFRCYPDATNVNDGSGNAKLVRVLPAPVEDPGYLEPAWLTNATQVPFRGDSNHDVSVPANTGNVSGTGTNIHCTGSFTRIGPGHYRKIDIGANSCVVFDPAYGLTSGQQPGIYYIGTPSGQLTIGQGSFVIGDGVSIFFDSSITAGSGQPFNPGGGIVLNTGNASIGAIPTGAEKFGAWTASATNPISPWAPANASGATTWTTPSSGVGMTFYVRRPASGTTTIFNMSGASPLMFNGVLYGPRDNVGIGGNGVQAAVGQIVGWTISYNGTNTITQTFDGPEEGRSYLLEPRTGQGD